MTPRFNKAAIEDKLLNIISEKFCVERKDISLSSRFSEDLDADSLDFVELRTEIEYEFDVDILEDSALSLLTPQDCLDYLEQHCG